MHFAELLAWLTSPPVLRGIALIAGLAILFAVAFVASTANECRKSKLLSIEAKEERESARKFEETRRRLKAAE